MGNMFATNLRFLRTSNGLTQEDLAKVLGVTRTAIGNWEVGIREPRVEQGIRIAEHFGVSFHSMVCDDLSVGSDEVVLSADEKALVLAFRKLSATQKEAAFNLVSALGK